MDFSSSSISPQPKSGNKIIGILVAIVVVLVIVAIVIVLSQKSLTPVSPNKNIQVTDQQRQQAIQALINRASATPVVTDAQRQQAVQALTERAKTAPAVTDAQRQQAIQALLNR